MADYTTPGLPPPPAVSRTTIPMAGLLVDVYGLEELPPPGSPLTCLWLLHPRTRTRLAMQDIARRTLHAWHHARRSPRGLVALALDMPNHGSRLLSREANLSWEEGNPTHGIDLAGLVGGAASDLSLLMGLAAGYLGRGDDVDFGHVCLGWSLGGHAAWWSLFGEERMDGGVVVVGCADYLSLMTNRLRDSRLDAPTSPPENKALPPDLLSTLQSHDPKGLLFGAAPPPPPSLPLPDQEQARLRRILDARVRGKKILVCSGGDDRLVPYERSAPLLALLRDAARPGGWYEDGGLVLEDKLYEGVGHAFCADMVHDAVRFLVRIVGEGPRREGRGRE